MRNKLSSEKGQKKTHLAAVSAVCSVAALWMVLRIRNEALYQLLTHFVLNTGMILACFGCHGKKAFLENWMVTYLLVLFLGGSMEWLGQIGVLASQNMLRSLAAFAMLYAALTYAAAYRIYGRHLFLAHIRKDGRRMAVTAYWDSGNLLRDPYTGRAVSILSRGKAKEFLQIKKDRIRYVPYRSLGEQAGLLAVTDVEELAIRRGRHTVRIHPAEIGIAQEGLLEQKGYDLILHAELFDAE